MTPAPARLVLICGLPASGKTVLARELAQTIPAVRLNKDDWVTQLGHDVWDDEFRVRIEAELWALSQELLAHGQSVILEWGHWARAERDQKRLAARALGVGVELHYLDVPLEELIARVERRSAAGEWTASPITRAHMEQWWATFQAPGEDELRLFDEPLVAGAARASPLGPDDVAPRHGREVTTTDSPRDHNLALLRRLYDGLEAGRIEDVTATFSPSIVVHIRGAGELDGTFRGHGEAEVLYRRVLAALGAGFKVPAHEVLVHDETLVVVPRGSQFGDAWRGLDVYHVERGAITEAWLTAWPPQP